MLKTTLNLLLTVFLMGSSIYLFKSCRQGIDNRKELRVYGVYTVGIISSYGGSGLSGHTVYYKYSIEGVKYEGNQSTNNLECAKNGYYNCNGMDHKLIYSTKNPKNSYLLISKDDYEWLHLKIPEELE